MRKSWWLINLVLLAGAFGMSWRLRADWRADQALNGPQAVPSSRLPLPSGTLGVAPRDYNGIARQNPFSADRNDVIAAPPQAAQLGPPPLYYGSVILGNQRFALLGAPANNALPQRVSEGQTFDGYKVAEVRPESIVFQTGEGTSELMLYNAITSLHRNFVKTAAVSSASSSSRAAAEATAGAPPAGASASTVVAAQPAPPLPPGGDHAGKHIMQTPFGPIWVKDSKP